MNRLSGLALLAVGFVCGCVVMGSLETASAQIRPSTIKEGPKLPTSVEMLALRIDALEERLDAKNKSLEAADRALEKNLSNLKTENVAQQMTIDRVNYEMTSPSGQIGLKKKLTQKAGWDRLPNDAYIVYYQR